MAMKATDRGAIVRISTAYTYGTADTDTFEIYDMPTTPTSGVARVKCIYAANYTGANGYIFLGDGETSGSVITEPCRVIPIGEHECVEYIPEDDWFITTGILAAASNGATGSGYFVWAEVEIIK